MALDLQGFDFASEIKFENRAVAVVWDFGQMSQCAVEAMNKAGWSPKEALAVALRLSVSGPKLDTFQPLVIGDKTITNQEVGAVLVGDPRSPNSLTISRYCAVQSTNIARYLAQHPLQVWGGPQTNQALPGVPYALKFPHCYYVRGLSRLERQACIAFLSYMDNIMTQSLVFWRPLSIKAMMYFRRVYGDHTAINGKTMSLIADGREFASSFSKP